MDYKGEDLDLRTPTSHAAMRAPGTFAPMSGNPAPARNGLGIQHQSTPGGTIWVDDVLLACCNHAYDVAIAHRAAQVQLEHLLYAITRVDAATEVLEANGVQDAGLRRESAMVIASKIPVGTTQAGHHPSGARAFKEALQVASGYAASFNRPAGIADLLHVFTRLRPNLPGLDLLRRHMTRAPASQQRTYDPLKVQTTTQTPPAPTPTPGSTRDMMQDKRLEALEQMVRALGQDIALERQANAASAYRETHTYTQPYTPPAPQVSTPAPAFSPHDLDQAGSGLAAVLEQLSMQLTRLDDRLTSLEGNLGRDQSQDSHNIAQLAGRIDALDNHIRSTPGGTIDLTPLDARLNDIEVALLSQDGSSKDQAALDESIEDLRENFAHSIDDLRHTLNERIDKLGENTSAQFSSLHSAHDEAGAAISAELKAISGASATHAASAERNLTSLRDKVEKLEAENVEARGHFVDELREVHDAIMKLNTNQHTLADSITNWHQDHVRDLDIISERLAKIEDNTTKPLEEIQRVSANVANLSTDMDAMYRATVQRYHRRNRFWFWLFGTDDWVGASWPSQTARIEDELRALKRMRKDA